MHKLLVVFAAFTSVCVAQTTPSIVNDPSAPVKIISTLASTTDLEAAVTVANTSNKEVTAVTLGLIVTIPQSCANVPFTDREHTKNYRITIQAGQNGTIQSAGVAPQAFQRLMQRHGAIDIVPQIAIVRTTFSDGSSWSASPRTGNTYDDAKAAIDGALRCSKVSPSGNPLSLASGRCKGKLVRAAGQSGTTASTTRAYNSKTNSALTMATAAA